MMPLWWMVAIASVVVRSCVRHLCIVHESATLVGINRDLGSYEFISHSGGLVCISDDCGVIDNALKKVNAKESTYPIMLLEHYELGPDEDDGVCSSGCMSAACIGSSTKREVRQLFESIGGVIAVSELNLPTHACSNTNIQFTYPAHVHRHRRHHPSPRHLSTQRDDGVSLSLFMNLLVCWL